MAYQNVAVNTGETITLRPIGAGGVDLFTDPSALDPSVLSRCENVDLSRSTADRRPGAIKLSQVVTTATSGHAYTFGADTKYATFAPPLIPAGGFAVVLHFEAVRPASGKTAYILSSRPTVVAYHVLSVTLSDAGVITVAWRDSSATAHSVACTAVADGLAVHLLAIFDAVAGTFTVYVNGSSSGTPLTGLDSTLKPLQTASVTWAFGVEKQTGAAVTADTHFDGAHDGMTLFTLRGLRPASGTTTMAETLRRHSARAWPSPSQVFILAHYDMDETSGTVMYDRSNQKNHGTYVGTPTVGVPVALVSAPCNYLGTIDVPSGKANIVAVFGKLFYESQSQAVV